MLILYTIISLNTNTPKKLDLDMSNFNMNIQGALSISLSDLGYTVTNVRSDSPVLESIDQELAKYAKLKDLEKVYDKEEDKNIGTRDCHVPDGASNPDLNRKQTSLLKAEEKVHNNHVFNSNNNRRSPGTGQSSCSSDPEVEDKVSKRSAKVKDGGVKVKMKTATIGKQKVPKTEIWKVKEQSEVISDGHDVKNNVNKTNKVPRFSRLFGKKVSKSPLKVTSKEDKIRRQSSKTESKVKATLSPKSQEMKVSSPKNAKGTSSSCKESSAALTKSKNKSIKNTSSSIIPSPYSFPSQKKSKKNSVETSSNDSGFSGNEVVRLRVSGVQGVRGAYKNSEKLRAKHCRSSGYESSLADSIESPDKDKEGNLVELTLNENLGKIEPLPVLKYGSDYIKRLDAMNRVTEVKTLKKKQEILKEEMTKAKDRIGADPKRWSFELHVEDSGFDDPSDPAFVEAFAKETHILKKRVDACKAHVRLMTCFDAQSQDTNHCTTECEFAQNIILKPDENETDIF